MQHSEAPVIHTVLSALACTLLLVIIQAKVAQ